MTYSEKLKDPRWQKRRLEIMERDGFACKHCQDKETTLNVHHKYYKRGAAPWEYEDHELVTLCQPCHERIESTIREMAVFVAECSINHRVMREYMDFQDRGIYSTVPGDSQITNAVISFSQLLGQLIGIMHEPETLPDRGIVIRDLNHSFAVTVRDLSSSMDVLTGLLMRPPAS